jgi:hypothetical protein
MQPRPSSTRLRWTLLLVRVLLLPVVAYGAMMFMGTLRAFMIISWVLRNTPGRIEIDWGDLAVNAVVPVLAVALVVVWIRLERAVRAERTQSTPRRLY